MPKRIHPSSPEAWWVATMGAVAMASVATQMDGVMGSCRWSTSKRSRSRTRLTRTHERGLRQMFGSEPLAGTMTERPTGITFGGGSP